MGLLLQAVLDSLEVYPKESLTIVRPLGFVFLAGLRGQGATRGAGIIDCWNCCCQEGGGGTPPSHATFCLSGWGVVPWEFAVHS